MKSFIVLFTAMVLMILAACKSPDKKNAQENTDNKEAAKTAADSLMNDVMDGHDAGMAKMGKLNAMEKTVQRVLDSIAKLPAKAKQAAGTYRAKLEEMVNDLRSAKAGMEKWMDEFNMDSAVNNMEQRIKYLTEEKLRVSEVKKSILGSLQKADSLLKAKI